ncbi:MAG TPA: response regulator transcription factor [Pyrinomonadaceae bacterium]|nr:response regulator transcription factor [Pyrinomonadaceae bacterium]
METKTRILLAEDHGTVREGIKLLVNSQPDMTVVGEAADGAEAVKKVKELTPDLVVMDISMPELNGLKATKKIRQTCPNVKILTLTRHMDHGYLQQLIKAGANGYVLKQSAPTELINAIKAVRSGKSYIDPALMQKVMGVFAGRSEALRGVNANDITEREAEILRLIAWGYSNKEIAGRLELSVKTVETHKTNTMRKLGMSSRIDIVRYALLQGWLQDN